LGEEFLHRLMIVRDKTLVKGAILIDDKPQVSGIVEQPEWTHVIFTRSYNKDRKGNMLHFCSDDELRVVQGVPRLNRWSEWRQVVVPLWNKQQQDE
jgi:hypothetical protein